MSEKKGLAAEKKFLKEVLERGEEPPCDYDVDDEDLLLVICPVCKGEKVVNAKHEKAFFEFEDFYDCEKCDGFGCLWQIKDKK